MIAVSIQSKITTTYDGITVLPPSTAVSNANKAVELKAASAERELTLNKVPNDIIIFLLIILYPYMLIINQIILLKKIQKKWEPPK